MSCRCSASVWEHARYLLQRDQLAARFAPVKKIENPIICTYLRWRSIKLGDKIEDFRKIPLTPYVAHLLESLPRSDAVHSMEWVFFSEDAASDHIQ